MKTLFKIFFFPFYLVKVVFALLVFLIWIIVSMIGGLFGADLEKASEQAKSILLSGVQYEGIDFSPTSTDPLKPPMVFTILVLIGGAVFWYCRH